MFGYDHRGYDHHDFSHGFDYDHFYHDNDLCAHAHVAADHHHPPHHYHHYPDLDSMHLIGRHLEEVSCDRRLLP